MIELNYKLFNLLFNFIYKYQNNNNNYLFVL